MNTLSSTQLTTLNEKAAKLRFNRLLNIQDSNSTEGFVLKADGKHIIKPIMFPHTNADGLVSCRCLVYMALEGSDEPQMATLDISVPDYKKMFGQTKVLIH